MTDLKPCPFCGGDAGVVDIEDGENAGGSCFCCLQCLASGNIEFGSKENFVSNWNRRHAAASTIQTSALNDVWAERQRQVTGERWTPEHDDEHDDGELAAAAATYAMSAANCIVEQPYWRTWPWQAEWWKPTTQRRDLVKAGALILAEIERLDRLSADEAMD